jgi:hypothetical protein
MRTDDCVVPNRPKTQIRAFAALLLPFLAVFVASRRQAWYRGTFQNFVPNKRPLGSAPTSQTIEHGSAWDSP